MMSKQEYEFFVCDRCNNFKRRLITNEKVGLLCNICYNETDALLRANPKDMQVLNAASVIYKKAYFKRIQAQKCLNCGTINMVEYKGVRKCFNCDKVWINPQLYIEENGEIKRIGQVIATYQTKNDIPKALFLLQKHIEVLIFEIKDQSNQELIYIVWLPG